MLDGLIMEQWLELKFWLGFKGLSQNQTQFSELSTSMLTVHAMSREPRSQYNTHLIPTALRFKALDTFCTCQSHCSHLVYPNFMHTKTNLYKFGLIGHRSCKRIREEKTPLSHKMCFQMPKKALIFEWGLTSFSGMHYINVWCYITYYNWKVSIFVLILRGVYIHIHFISLTGFFFLQWQPRVESLENIQRIHNSKRR